MPEVFDTIEAVRAQVRGWQSGGERVALVPTMGNLHAGHMALVEAARQNADRVVASIFVNPTQFSAGEDFDAYPRTFSNDCELLDQAGADAVFAPGIEVMYPHGQDDTTIVEVPDIAHILCGEFRPGHFVGVTTVVAKLFHMVPADLAVFGEKDFQQLLAIRRMVAELDFPIEIMGVPTMREDNGLAMSSRNRYLSEEQRAQAAAIHASMQTTRKAIEAGEMRTEAERDELQQMGMSLLRDAGLDPEYFELRNADNLKPARLNDERVVLLVAARLGKARLIDNLMVR